MKKATTKSNAKSAKDRRREKREYYQLFKEHYSSLFGKPKGIKKWILFRLEWFSFWRMQSIVLKLSQ